MFKTLSSNGNSNDSSLSEIQVKQNKWHGLMIVNHEVFKQLNGELQLLLTNLRILLMILCKGHAAKV